MKIPTFCNNCNCMTKTLKDDLCGKCNAEKETMTALDQETLLELLAYFDDYNHPLEMTAEYVREQIIKLMDEETMTESTEWEEREAMIKASAEATAMQNLTMWKAEIVEHIEGMKNKLLETGYSIYGDKYITIQEKYVHIGKMSGIQDILDYLLEGEK